MNKKITFKLAAFALSGLANATDTRSRPVERDDAGRHTLPGGGVAAAPFPDRGGRENAPPAHDGTARGVLRAEVQRLGVAFQATLRGGREGVPPPALDDAERGAAEPSPAQANSTREQDCIIGNIDFGNSTVGALMTRGFPLFTDFGLDMGKVSDAYFELEPMYEINMENWKEYTAGTSSSQVWTKKEREYFGGGGGDRIDSRLFLYSIGYEGVMNGALLSLTETAFEKFYGPTQECSLNSYCREAGEFARSVGAEPPQAEYALSIYWGPLNMRTPFSTAFSFTDQDGIKFTEGYLEALEALPEVYDREAYLAFGQRFGLGRSASSFQFSNTDVFVAGEEYITMGSKNYEGQECANPEPGGVTYTFVSEWLLATLSPIQKARFETLNEIENLVDMVFNNTLPPSPTASPSIPLLSLAPSSAPVTTPTSGSQIRKQSALLAVFALFCNLFM